MLYVHILGYASMPTREIYKLLSENFNRNEHYIITGSVDHENFTCIENGCPRIKTYSLETIKMCYKADFIVIHGFINTKLLYFFLFQPWFLHKCNWIVWGGDIYCHEIKNRKIKDQIYEIMRQMIYPRIGFVTTLVEHDYEKAVEWYHLNGHHLRVAYPFFGGNQNKQKKKKGNCVNIQIGNSATETNHHYEALDMLAHLKNEHIHLYLPLSYGNSGFREYARDVVKYAEKIFGKTKVSAFWETMDGESYLEFLNSIDVAIFNNDRQQAMGNISQLLMCGAKVYARKTTTMWEHFTKIGCILNDIESVKQETLEQLIYEQTSEVEKNRAVVAKRNESSVRAGQWKKMFDDMIKYTKS